MTQSILITGASTGIGEACALHFIQQGWTVFAGVRKQIDAERLRNEAGDGLMPLLLDVTVPDQIEQAQRAVADHVGERGLDGLVNNAGIAVSGPMELIPMNEFRRQFEVNVLGQVAVTQAFIPMLRQAQGRIINISSLSGQMVFPFFGAYAGSKFALEAFSDALRRELAPWNIRVAVIEPGAVKTPIWDKSIKANTDKLEALNDDRLELYRKSLDAILDTAARNGANGMDVEVVVDSIHHAMTHDHPKTRYLLLPGGTPFFYRTLIRALPDRWLDRIIKRRT